MTNRTPNENVEAQLGPKNRTSTYFTSSSTSAYKQVSKSGLYRISCSESIWYHLTSNATSEASKGNNSHYLASGAIDVVYLEEDWYVAYIRHDTDGAGSISFVG